MTDKPIIVDNIDVSKCEFLIISNDKHLCHCIKSDLFGGIEFVENAKNGNCKDNPNCYFKQLQREKQNSQEARDTSIKEFNRVEELNTLLKHKQQECEELKRDVERWKSNFNGKVSAIEELLQQLEQLKAEKQGLIKDWEEKKNLAYEIACKNGKLERTLTEIKEICNSVENIENINSLCDAKLSGMYLQAHKILRKISECEAEDELY